MQNLFGNSEQKREGSWQGRRTRLDDFFLPKCDYLPTVSHGGEGLDFRLSEQVIKTESSLLPKQLGHHESIIQLHLSTRLLDDLLFAEVWLSAYCLTRRWRSGLLAFRTGRQDGVQPFAQTIRTSRIYHTITPSQQDSCGYDKVRPSILQVWNSDFQNRSSRRNPAFSLYNWTSRIYHTTTPSQQTPCGYDKVWTMIIQCTYDTEYCWRSTGLTGPSQASSIHLLTTAARWNSCSRRVKPQPISGFQKLSQYA